MARFDIRKEYNSFKHPAFQVHVYFRFRFSRHPVTMARLLTSYILWFFGGIFGVHHFYLGRDRQAFVWWATLGGVFGLGWCRDLWRIPAYVHECNEDRNDNNNGANSNMDGNGKRKLGPVRFFGMILVGMCFGYLIQSACPAKWTRKNAVFEFVYKWVLVPCSSALGKFYKAQTFFSIRRGHRKTCTNTTSYRQ